MTPPAEPQRLELAPGLWLDARRAAWLPESRTLIVADLHLGYAWVQRQRGALLPVGTPDGALERLAALASDFQPARWVLLGDIVHAAAPTRGVEEALRTFDRILGGAERTGCTGNHDRKLGPLIERLGIRLGLTDRTTIGDYAFEHGDAPVPEPEFALAPSQVRTVIGHEHPCLALGAGVATSLRAPCALVGNDTVVLPAFSDWAAGCVVGARPFLGPRARGAVFTHAVACLERRLLKIPIRLTGR
jgi:uncharacterized protein